jgi:archaemetzincin
MTRSSIAYGIMAHALLIAFALWLFGAGCPGPPPTPHYSGSLPQQLDLLRPLHQPFEPGGPNDWVADHPEPGQTYEQWRGSDPVTPNGTRRFIYIQPIGDFTPEQRRIVELTAECMALYFHRPVKFLDDLPADRIPANARRRHPSWGMKQILTGYVLYEVLKPNLPKDAAALIGFTATDLWPGRGWNFVFGQATLKERVGVWSIARNGDPAESDESFRVCLLRTVKTATHETGHMFSMEHCIAYQCNLCGCNNRAESDRRPLPCCPECAAKICDATGADAIERYDKLAAFTKTHGLDGAHRLYARYAQTLREAREK